MHVDNSSMDTDFGTDSPARQYRVLLADDSAIERLAMGHFLRRAGYTVDEAEDGKSALHHLQNREVDVLLLDLQMPGMSGFEILSYLQQHRRGLPVIVLSGMAVDEIELNMHNLPSQELPTLFLKPVDVEQLLSFLSMRLSGQLPDIATTEAKSVGRS